MHKDQIPSVIPNSTNAMLAAVSCVNIEVAIMEEFNFRQNLIVPNVSNMMLVVPFETDMIVLTKSNFAYGFEIKISKSDLKADFKKPQHRKFNEMKNGKVGLERWFSKFKYFYYAVPENLKESALELIPDFAGLWCLKKWQDGTQIKKKFYQVREPKKLSDYKWSEKQRYELARLGAMRIYSLKAGLSNRC